ncbi:MAG: LacI family DNA-binding transcriptional regulator [Chloroherpetonaceae bacterium]|nr:LacI family DNA-binding transcriptional regulator [Chloroherpetonaceae bacterium]
MQNSRRSRAVTLKDLAEQSGLTTAAVSMILNGRGKFKVETVAKVREIAEKLNYVPNVNAYRLVKQQTNLIGLLVPNINAPFTIEVLCGVEAALKGSGYNLVIYSTTGKAEEEEKIYREIARGKQVDGIVVQLFDHSERRTKLFSSFQLPCVVIEADLKSLDSISVDNVLGAFEATEYLIKMGRKKIIFVYASQSTVMKERLEGYLSALKKHRIPPLKEHILEIESSEVEKFHFDEGVKIVRLVQEKIDKKEMPKFDAVFCANGDEVAAGVIRGLGTLNLRVPQDVAVIGYDDQPIARTAIPALTTVRQPIQEMGSKAVKFLLNRLENPKHKPQVLRINPELILRETA